MYVICKFRMSLPYLISKKPGENFLAAKKKKKKKKTKKKTILYASSKYQKYSYEATKQSTSDVLDKINFIIIVRSTLSALI